VLQTYINGELVAENGDSRIASQTSGHINNFNCSKKTVTDFHIAWKNETTIPVIEALDGQLITNKLLLPPKTSNGYIVSDTERDILKIAVVNRYTDAVAALAFIKNTGLKQGAIASSVAHDSHNIVAVGVDDESLCKAVNLVIEQQGGVSCVSSETSLVLPLPVAGLMSAEDGYKVASSY
jgi:adenine deaminase